MMGRVPAVLARVVLQDGYASAEALGTGKKLQARLFRQFVRRVTDADRWRPPSRRPHVTLDPAEVPPAMVGKTVEVRLGELYVVRRGRKVWAVHEARVAGFGADVHHLSVAVRPAPADPDGWQ